ncbi:MAG: hypothetical protein KDK33_17710, partial [Leptospiraceae bacterium]|nr:hypothetical protein [Leptospiraceae bacterium]
PGTALVGVVRGCENSRIRSGLVNGHGSFMICGLRLRGECVRWIHGINLSHDCDSPSALYTKKATERPLF